MTTKTDGGAAFPVQQPRGYGGGGLTPSNGMTLRDYFAAKAMQARLSDYESAISLKAAADKHGIPIAEEVAVQAYAFADAMLRVRENKS